jgi:hypothetical protein
MPDPSLHPDERPDRRGMDGVTLAFVRALHAQFVEAHADIHTVYVASHEREHTQVAEAHREALELSGRRIADLDKAIREHFDTILAERDNRYEERFAASQVAVSAALAEQEKARSSAFVSAEKAIAAAFDASKEAIAKSEVSVIKQSDATFVKIDKIQEMLAMIMPKEEVLSRFESITDSVAEMRKAQDTYLRDVWDRLKTLEASKQGHSEHRSETQMMVPWLVAIISLIGVAVAIIVAIGGNGTP